MARRKKKTKAKKKAPTKAREANRLRTVGRPPSLTPEIQETICGALRVGNYIEPSAALAGVPKATLYSWLKRGGEERRRLNENPKAKPLKREAPYVEFLDAIREAEATAEARDVAIIAMAAEKHWNAAAWRLARKNHARWGNKSTNVIEGGDKPIKAAIVMYPTNPRDEGDE